VTPCHRPSCLDHLEHRVVSTAMRLQHTYSARQVSRPKRIPGTGKRSPKLTSHGSFNQLLALASSKQRTPVDETTHVVRASELCVWHYTAKCVQTGDCIEHSAGASTISGGTPQLSHLDTLYSMDIIQLDISIDLHTQHTQDPHVSEYPRTVVSGPHLRQPPAAPPAPQLPLTATSGSGQSLTPQRGRRLGCRPCK
jgi:hypothetical protein